MKSGSLPACSILSQLTGKVMAPRNILFLCTGNSARSIMAEAYVTHVAPSRWRAFSAGSHPTGAVNPLALEALKRSGIHVDGAHSKNWNTFAAVFAQIKAKVDGFIGEQRDKQ